ncbi:hypothetical protein [Mycobacterium ulcerans]|uniref:hypothetical protein n=1 Tax=Mycobacterium ulcerans TaxID=1809 RepID=UPI0015D5E5E4|nr:hypothetical protein [Mycobacterium ulcerans]
MAGATVVTGCRRVVVAVSAVVDVVVEGAAFRVAGAPPVADQLDDAVDDQRD